MPTTRKCHDLAKVIGNYRITVNDTTAPLYKLNTRNIQVTFLIAVENSTTHTKMPKISITAYTIALNAADIHRVR